MEPSSDTEHTRGEGKSFSKNDAKGETYTEEELMSSTIYCLQKLKNKL